MTNSIPLMIAVALTAAIGGGEAAANSTGFTSIDTGHTICKVRAASQAGTSYIVASSYEGALLGISFDGKRLWKNALSGFMNRDVWCEDITGDGTDEILAANADGALYRLDGEGKLLWQFKANDAPMNAVCVIRYAGAPYVVCGGYDMKLYYLTAEGERGKTVDSVTYSKEKPWGKSGERRFPEQRRNIANFIRTVRGPDGEETLAAHGTLNSNATTGSIYLFKPMADKPFRSITKLEGGLQQLPAYRKAEGHTRQYCHRPCATARLQATGPRTCPETGLHDDGIPWRRRRDAGVESGSRIRQPRVPERTPHADCGSLGPQHRRQRAIQKARDWRKRYALTQQQVLDEILPLYDGDRKGAAFWGGHGNDPYMFSTDTMKRIADGARGNMSVFIYPELEHYDDDFALVLKEHFYPMAEHFQGKRQYIYVRTKHAFWQSIVYMPLWSRLLSGEFADVFVPSMVETTDKTMEQSVAGRIGIWASGAVNQWGSRGARDNPSFDRLRQHSHQMIPNHFLRTQIYNIACGATFQNNFPVNQQYFSILYGLIAKGVLYVPDRGEIVSFNPVHLSMTEPDEHYVDEGNNAKWLTLYDEESEWRNPMVFSRLKGTWPGSPVTEWDYSRYAAGVKDRRLNFLPPYENGLVLITPPQNGKFADKSAPRGALTDHLHPIYKNIMKEYITDGRNYISADGRKTFAADEYYRTVEADIQNGAKELPLTVSGGVAWVTAQSSPTHLRLTLIDSGYINPQARTATVHFHTVKPVRMTDVLTGNSIDITDPSSVNVDIPCGLFRFLDIEVDQALGADRHKTDSSSKPHRNNE